MIDRPESKECHVAFGRYIDLVPEGDILEILEKQSEHTMKLYRSLSEEKLDYAYAPGKWTPREILGHVVDGERVFAYRALSIARGDQQNLPGFDENMYAATSGYAATKLDYILDQYQALRRSNILMFRQFPNDTYQNKGIANSNPITVRSLVYIVAGHELHHRRVLAERYQVSLK